MEQPSEEHHERRYDQENLQLWPRQSEAADVPLTRNHDGETDLGRLFVRDGNAQLDELNHLRQTQRGDEEQ